MRWAYDFHIHTAASPCADETMTPNNIVNMALLKELDAIAITDHNTCANVAAVLEVAKGTMLTVLPGMEIETSEEFHIVALFETLEQVMTMEGIVQGSMPSINNRKDIFGDQVIYNAQDQIVGEIGRLLLTASGLSIYELARIITDLGGICYPAHIDRPSYSIISSLGSIPPDLGLRNIEISKHANKKNFEVTYPAMRIVQSSDAHYLGDMLERQSYMAVKANTSKEWITKMRSTMIKSCNY